MPLGTKWRVEFETIEPIGDVFIDGAIVEGIGQNSEDKDIVKKIKISCLKELTKEEYKKHDEEREKWDKEHGIIHGH